MAKIPPSQRPVVERLMELGKLVCPRPALGSLHSVVRRYEKLGIVDACEVSAPSPAAATHYDGLVDGHLRAEALIGLADGKKGTVVVWFENLGNDIQPLDADQDYFSCFAAYSQDPMHPYIQVTGFNSAGQAALQLNANLPVGPSGEFICVMASWDLGAGIRQIYLGDVESNNGQGYTVDREINYARPGWCISGAVDTGDFFAAGETCFGPIFFHDDYIDFSIESNRRKFFGAEGHPVALGANGELPFGVSPVICCPAGNGVNVGTGGDFTAVGAPGACENLP